MIWEAKAPTEVKRYSWAVPVRDGDGLASFNVTASGATVDSEEMDGNNAVLYVSGGSAATTASFAFTAETEQGESLVETIYLPIIAPGSTAATTAGDIVDFALRPIVGLSGTATAAESADALEWLNDMLAAWKAQGADVGSFLPLVSASVLYCPDAWVAAIKANLRMLVAEQYGRQVSPVTARQAIAGLQGIKFDRLRDREPTKAEYF